MAVADIAPSERVIAYTERFRAFLDTDVAGLEQELARHGAGTASGPKFDEHGRMHPTVWEARREVQRRSAARGLYAPHTGTAAGGGGFGRVEMHHVEEFVYRHSGLGLGLAALAWTEGPNPAVEHCSPAMREQYLAPLMAGEITAAFCNTELGAGSDVLRMATRATRDGDDWIINGTKGWITNSHFADVLQVVAVTDPGARTRSLSMFLIDAGAPGVSRGVDLPTTMADGLTGTLQFDDVRVPAENVVGEVGDGFGLAMSWINWRRLCRAGCAPAGVRGCAGVPSTTPGSARSAGSRSPPSRPCSTCSPTSTPTSTRPVRPRWSPRPSSTPSTPTACRCTTTRPG